MHCLCCDYLLLFDAVFEWLWIVLTFQDSFSHSVLFASVLNFQSTIFVVAVVVKAFIQSFDRSTIFEPFSSIETHSCSPAFLFFFRFLNLICFELRTNQSFCIQFTFWKYCLESFNDVDHIYTSPYALWTHRFEFQCVFQFPMHTRPICCEMLSIRFAMPSVLH